MPKFKVKVITSIFFSAVILATSISPVFSELSSEPNAKPPLNQRDKFNTDILTGSATYSYPIKVPKGTNDLTPEVSLNYNSAGVRDMRMYSGIGWLVNTNSIERDINGTPNDQNDDKFKLHLNGSVHDLVYVSADGKYHTKVETYLKIEKIDTGSNTTRPYWQVTTPDGTKYRFGFDTQSELECNERSYISVWNLDLVTDMNNNKVYYTYMEEYGMAYLRKIEYNNDKSRLIEFNYNLSSYERPGYTQGCYAYDVNKLDSIGVFADSDLVREYSMSYTTASNSQPILNSVTEKGSEGASHLTTTFDYKSVNKGWNNPPELWINQNININLGQENVTLSDVNADGLLDIVETILHTGPIVSWKVYMNLGNSWSTQPQPWVNQHPLEGAHLDREDVQLIDVTGDNLPDIVMSPHAEQWWVWRNTGTSWSVNKEHWVGLSAQCGCLKLGDPSTRLTDMTGDGLPDIVRTVGGSSVQWEVFRNTGGSWKWQKEVWDVGSVPYGLDNADIRLIDVNNDGLTDVVRAFTDGSPLSTWDVWINTGSGLKQEYAWVDDYINAHFGIPDTTVADVNGDGLVDIVKSEGTENRWKVFYNYGDHWGDMTDVDNWIETEENIDIDVHNNKIKLTDVTGDGLPDIVKGESDKWSVWVNKGVAPFLLSAVHTERGGVMSFDYMESVTAENPVGLSSYTGQYFNNRTLSGSPTLTRTDANINFNWGTGSPDSSIPADNFSVRWTKTANFPAGIYTFNSSSDDGVRVYVDGQLIIDKWFDQSPQTYTVSKTLTEGSHTIVYEYYEAGSGAVAKLDYRKENSQKIPFNIWVVSKMTINNGLTNGQGTTDTTTYSYKDALYKWQDKEFRGFKEISTVEPNLTKKKYVFHQGLNNDEALKGKLQELQVRDSQNNPYEEVEYTYANTSSNGVYNANVTQEKHYTYDGTATNPKIKQIDYLLDAYGNITKKSELGDTNVTGDERFTYNEYTYNTTDWIVNTPKKTYLHAANDSTKIAETSYYYDGHTGLSDAPTEGNLTKEVKWTDGLFTTDPTTEYTYDAFGNQTEIEDANGHFTYTNYDTTGTYPTFIKNAKDHESYVGYDLGTGNLLYKTDPNGNTTNYVYDQFGRIVKEIKPGDDTQYPTSAYTYYTSGVDGTKVSKKENVGSTSATLDTYTWVDGLGRTISTRTDAENSSKQIVTNTYYDPTGQVKEVTVPHEDDHYDYYRDPLTGIKKTSTTYDVLGRPSVITNPKGDNKTIAYDHWKETTTDENNNIKREFKNAFGKIVKVEEVNDAATYETTYEYDARDLLTKITDHEDNDITFSYDALGRKTSMTDPDMGTWEYEYDAVGNLTKQTDNRNVEVVKEYDEINRLKKTNYPTETDVVYTYDGNSKKGTLTSVTDAAGTVAYTYDTLLRKTAEARTVGGVTKTTQFAFDPMDRVTSQTNPDSEVITNTFNNQGEIESVSNVVSNVNYNALGKITQKTFNNGLSTNYTYNTTDFRLNRIQTSTLQDLNYTYDNVGNVASITDAVDSKTQAFTYDDLDRLKTASESAGYNQVYEYSPIGNLTKFTNGVAETDYGYGANGKPHAMTSSSEKVAPPQVNGSGTPLTSSIIDDWSTGTINSAKWYNWGGSNVSMDDEELVMESSLGGGYYGIDSDVNDKLYDLTWSSVTNELVSAGNQSIGTWEVYPLYVYEDGDTSTQYFFYISENRLKAYKKVSGTNTQLTDIAYNSTNHRWFRITEWDGTTYFDVSADGSTWNSIADTANAFDVSTVVVGSQVGTWATESSTTTAIFDNFNYAKAPTATITDDWSTGSIDSGRWLNWGGSEVSVADEQLQMDSILGGGYFGIDSDVSGKMYNMTNFSVVNQVVNAGNQSLGTWEVYPLYIYPEGDNSYQYYFYISENTLKAYKKVDGTSTQLASASYNAANHKWFRIREASGTTYFDTSADGGTWSNFASTGNEFEALAVGVGVMIGTWDTEASTTTAKFDNFNVWNPVYVYDANGNMTSDGVKCYTYNEANQLSKVQECGNSHTIAEYVYDYNGLRMVKKNFVTGTLANTVVSWSDGYETKTKVGGTPENTTYYWVNSELLAKKDSNGDRFYYHNDHLGSSALLTDENGDIAERTAYDPWGKVKSGGTQSKFQYTGQEMDSETGLSYYNARYYSTDIRRFTQPDDIIQDVYNPQTLNRYSYVQNNPLKYTDPTGHVSILDYNKMLSNPTAKNYNNILNQFAVLSGNKANQNYSAPNAQSSNNSAISAAVAAAGSVIQQNQKQGASFERTVISSYNATKNTAGLAGYGNRIPDLINYQTRVMTEIKSSSYIYLNPQLRDMIQFAKDNGYQFNLVTKDGARISEPLRNAVISIEAGGTIIPYIRSAPVAPVPILLLNPGIISPNSSLYQNDGNVQQL